LAASYYAKNVAVSWKIALPDSAVSKPLNPCLVCLCGIVILALVLVLVILVLVVVVMVYSLAYVFVQKSL